jgi:hypothetical protein
MKLSKTVCNNIIDNTTGKPLEMIIVDAKYLKNINHDELIKSLKNLFKEE